MADSAGAALNFMLNFHDGASGPLAKASQSYRMLGQSMNKAVQDAARAFRSLNSSSKKLMTTLKKLSTIAKKTADEIHEMAIVIEVGRSPAVFRAFRSMVTVAFELGKNFLSLFKRTRKMNKGLMGAAKFAAAGA